MDEHRFHQLGCELCGAATRALLSEIVESSGYGERVVAHVALLSSLYRQSHRMVQRLMQELFGVVLSVGSVNQLRTEASAAVAEAVAQTQSYVQQQAVVGIDETSFEQGNADRQNPTMRRGWLWVVVTPLVSFFQVHLSRSQAAAQSLLGSEFAGLIISDRYSAYNWLDESRRQVCWAHQSARFYSNRRTHGSLRGIDAITGFNGSERDKINVSASGFGGGLTIRSLSSTQFMIGSAATDASDRFIYNSFTGGLFFDVDGVGGLGQTQIASLSKSLNLTSSDFSIIG